MGVELYGGRTDVPGFAGVRTILVPPDIVAVQQRPPAPIKKKTPWRPRPHAEPTERAGGREWFSDRLFVEVQHDRDRAGFFASIAAHALAIALVVVLAAQLERAEVIRAGPPLVMPATLFMKPIADPPSPGLRSVERSPRAPARSEAAAPAAAAPAAEVDPPAPVAEPASIEPEIGAEGAGDGVAGGVAGGSGNESAGETGSSGTSSSGPLRVGATLQPPKKLKDVKPVYPQVTLSEQARGTVIIDVTIGTDGRVRDATIIRSVPQFDQAALDAVRQWQYEQTRLNGVLVSLIMTVIVNFTIQ